jgi:hypothetical protein
VPVAARLLTLTDHPGLDLVVVVVRVGDGAAGGSYSGSGLVMEMPRFHDTLRNTRGKRGADNRGSAIGREPSPLIARFPAGATPLFWQHLF